MYFKRQWYAQQLYLGALGPDKTFICQIFMISIPG